MIMANTIISMYCTMVLSSLYILTHLIIQTHIILPYGSDAINILTLSKKN